jgi:hypothetical protein
MRGPAAIALTLLGAGLAQAAGGGSTGGHSALALAALVGVHEPALTVAERLHLVRLLNDQMLHGAALHHTIHVHADAVDCTAGDIDIAAFACALKFGVHTVNLHGRVAHELFATIAEAGVPGDGAAGRIHEGLHALSCTIDPAVIAENAGGGADCAFQPGPP